MDEDVRERDRARLCGHSPLSVPAIIRNMAYKVDRVILF